MNGVPWWFCRGLRRRSAARRCKASTPAAAIAAAIPARARARLRGACQLLATTEPGLVRAPLRQRADHRRARGRRIGARRGGWPRCCATAGFEVTLSAQIQKRRHLVQAVGQHDDEPDQRHHRRDHRPCPRRRRWCAASCSRRDARGARDRRAHRHARSRKAPEDRHAVTRKLGAFKTSMLQDVEAGRAVELDALVTVVREIGAARCRSPRRTSTRCSA